jgi:Uma2 family endonuclease
MSTASKANTRGPARTVPPLLHGERLTQAEFHRRYEAYPEDVKFELIGGVVYMASPQSRVHSEYEEELGFLLGVYRRATPGVQTLPNVTTILGEESEPQPDLLMRIRPEYGGRSRDKGQYIEGAAEFLAEISYSTRALDLGPKKSDYQQAGVREYLVVNVAKRELHWFRFPRGSITANAQGIYQSRVFPGLWIDGQALLDLNSERVIEVLQQGLASREHPAFVKRLQAAYRKRK